MSVRPNLYFYKWKITFFLLQETFHVGEHVMAFFKNGGKTNWTEWSPGVISGILMNGIILSFCFGVCVSPVKSHLNLISIIIILENNLSNSIKFYSTTVM